MKKVLVVDDDKKILFLMKECLTLLGFEAILAEGGKVLIYSESGEKSEISVDSSMDQISTTGLGDKIFLSSKKTKNFCRSKFRRRQRYFE